MKHLTYADRSVLTGDEAADILVELSAILAETGHADSVTLNALGDDGDAIVAKFVLGTGTNLMSASTTSQLPEPENREAVAYMNEQIARLTIPAAAVPSDDEWHSAEPFEANL
ncbi:hypothetical protein HD599_002885 [Conyzicola lurida]|uniref:Uncharacterized protein n=1 Tax=Conyzicola lurida TaxID=1172621 RepID=A0A841ARJ4_9MICO|nr:hypothetical protein [Conyzicola lurida]MBB5844562.1 hypothetical protein [Conyzicola lurida]